MGTQTTTRETAAVNSVARETLRRIASERISPTPETYSRIYREIAVTHPDHPPPVSADDGGAGRQAASLIARLVTQVDAHHVGITVARKREGLKRALIPRAEPVEALMSRLHRLMDSWNGPNAETGTNVSQFLGTDILGSHHLATEAGSASTPMSAPLTITSYAHEPTRPANPSRASPGASDLPERVISLRITALLAMLLKNMADMTPESGPLTQQIEQIGRVLTAPLTEKKLDEAERCMRSLIMRQNVLKGGMDDTKRAVRELAASLLERLQTLVTSTDLYSTQVMEMSDRIATAENLEQLSDLTRMLVADSRLMSNNFAVERQMLIEARSRATAMEKRAESLEVELRAATALVRTDPLTGALNRRGFGDAYQAEVTLCDAHGLPSIALIDVDNFKRINEEYGHSVGDEVLCSLVEVLHRCALPNDLVARYGGEEFAVMFPASDLETGRRKVIAMQDALESATHGIGKRPLITFSAGVAQVAPGESLAQVITRADRALRRAKQAGKNCIVSAAVADTSVTDLR